MHEQLENAITKADAFMGRYPHICQYERLKDIEEKTGYSKVYFFAVGVLIFNGLLYLLGGIKLLSDLVTFLYPAYASFKAIDTAQLGDDTQWLTYWVVFSFFQLVENCMYFMVDWIPMYYGMKIGFFVWLYHPSFMGAGLIYAQVIRPHVLPYLNQAAASSGATKKAE